MKKYSMRVLACFMACVVAFNVIAIPRAKAVAGATTLGTAALAGYMTATGVPLTVISGGAGAAASGVTSIAAGYAAATGTTTSAVLGGIASGATITAVGTIALSAVAVAALAAIVAWAIDEYGMEPGADPVVTYAATDIYAPMADGSKLYLSPVHLVDMHNEFDSTAGTSFGPGSVLEFANGNVLTVPDEPANQYWIYPVLKYPSGSTKQISFMWREGCSFYFGFKPSDSALYVCTYVPVPDDNTYNSHTFAQTAGYQIYLSAIGAVSESSEVSTSLAEDYSGNPEVLEKQQMVIDVGAGEGATEETVYNLVFNGIADGTLSSTYEVADVEPGTDTEPDVGADADTELGFLERIANGIDVLADKIVEGFAEIFAPDPALMQDISDTFNSKFSFVSTLHQLGTDLLSIDATSTPPVVYIHLEDAEGSIYYGETVKALDMSWYARYKEDVDRIMSGFLWLGFLWLLFKRASAIINGAEMATDYGTDIHDGFRIRGERNGKRF